LIRKTFPRADQHEAGRKGNRKAASFVHKGTHSGEYPLGRRRVNGHALLSRRTSSRDIRAIGRPVSKTARYIGPFFRASERMWVRRKGFRARRGLCARRERQYLHDKNTTKKSSPLCPILDNVRSSILADRSGYKESSGNHPARQATLVSH